MTTTGTTHRSTRIGRRQLLAIADQLDTTDHRLLGLLAAHRYATTGQLSQLINASGRYTSPSSALRQTTRRLSRHQRLGLVSHLDRRIGGVRAGSTGYIWHLREPGWRLTQQTTETEQHAPTTPSRRWRHSDPSPTFLAHTLAITHTRVVIEQAARAIGGALSHLVTEPACWRSWTTLGGGLHWLKPDLEAITTTADGDQDHWLLEIDLGTENPARLITKCHDYQDHLSSGTEQAGNGGYYPQVVWVMNEQRRAEWLRRRVDEEGCLLKRLFKVVASEEELSEVIKISVKEIS